MKTAILKAVNSRVCKNNIKYGVQVPRTLKEARRLDKENGNDLWEKAYKKEMKNVGIDFTFLPRANAPQPGTRSPPATSSSMLRWIPPAKHAG